VADNVELSAGSGGAIIAADDIGPGVWYQRVKINHGADGSATDVSAASPLPVIGGSNSGVDIGDGTVNNGVGAAAVPIPDGGNSITVDGTVAVSGTVTVDGSGVTQPVSGTVTANLGATDNAVLDNIDADTSAIQTAVELIDDAVYVDDADWVDATSKHLLVGGLYQSSPQTVTDGDVAPFNITTNGALHVAQQGTVTVAGTVDLGATDNAVLDSIDADLTTIIGHVDGLEGLLTTIDADTSTLAAVDFATGADVASLGVTGGGVEATALRVTIASDSTGTLSVDDGGGALTVDGTVTANLSATDNAVLDDIAAKLATIDADTSALFGAVAGTEVQVDIVSSAAIPVTDNSGSLTVDDGGGALTVDGSVTANAGTNLNTSALALETGGNLAGAATSLAVIDDWDQSDRAKVNSQDVSGTVIENAIEVTVKRAIIDAATSGDNTIVAAVTNKKIRVLSLFLVSAGTVNVRFESGASGTALTGQMNLIANTGFVLPHNPHGWFQSGESALLNLELSAAISVDGALTYIEAE